MGRCEPDAEAQLTTMTQLIHDMMRYPPLKYLLILRHSPVLPRGMPLDRRPNVKWTSRGQRLDRLLFSSGMGVCASSSSVSSWPFVIPHVRFDSHDQNPPSTSKWN